MSHLLKRTLGQLAVDLSGERATSRALVEEALQKIAFDERAYTKIYREAALAAADAADARRRHGRTLSALDGIPFAIKDNMDVQGEVTAAGSKILLRRPPALADAEVVARLRQLGAIVLAKTYMPELALASVGTSRHCDVPPNALNPTRVPGGSTSGGAVAVAHGVVPASLGTDTGGSVTIPAALNNLVGYKPTATQLPLGGIVPLSRHLDSVGPIARSIPCCRTVSTALRGGDPVLPIGPERPVAGLRLGVPRNYVLDDLDPVVATAFERALATLSKAGAEIAEITIPEFDCIADIYGAGGFAMPEIAAWLLEQGVAEHDDDLDPRMLARIQQGRALPAVDMLQKLALRERIAASAAKRMRDWDALLIPTTPVCAPHFSEVETNADYVRLNMLLMRNTRVANILNLCAITVPLACPEPSVAVGLLVLGSSGSDDTLLDIAETIEKLVRAKGPIETVL